MDINEQRTRKASSGAPRPVARKCFICGFVGRSPDKEPPFRCDACYVRVAMNEADGDL